MKFFFTIRYDHGDIYGEHELTPEQVRILGFEGKYASFIRRSGDESICHADDVEDYKKLDQEDCDHHWLEHYVHATGEKELRCTICGTAKESP